MRDLTTGSTSRRRVRAALVAASLAACACSSTSPFRGAQPRAEATPSGSACTLRGTWNATWEAATGSFQTEMELEETPGKRITGTFTGGTLDAAIVGRDEAGRTVVRGTWHLTEGASAGPCADGTLYFVLDAEDGSDASPGCRLDGAWDYCARAPSHKWTAVRTSR